MCRRKREAEILRARGTGRTARSLGTKPGTTSIQKSANERETSVGVNDNSVD
jgi:hypothetical protein